MDKDILPVLILVVLVFIVGFVFMKSKTNKEPKAEVPTSKSDSNQTSQAPAKANDKNVAGAQENAVKPTEAALDTSKTYFAVLNTTEGTIKIQLNTKETPKTAGNFITLANKKFYDGTIFHRIIKGFMIQGGDPEGTGRGGPGYTFADEPFTGSYTRGTVAMANAGPNTNGSQFFIMHADYDLPKNYVIFGKVVEGMDVVDKIATAPTVPGGEGSTPVNPVTVTTAQIDEE